MSWHPCAVSFPQVLFLCFLGRGMLQPAHAGAGSNWPWGVPSFERFAQLHPTTPSSDCVFLGMQRNTVMDVCANLTLTSLKSTELDPSPWSTLVLSNNGLLNLGTFTCDGQTDNCQAFAFMDVLVSFGNTTSVSNVTYGNHAQEYEIIQYAYDETIGSIVGTFLLPGAFEAASRRAAVERRVISGECDPPCSSDDCCCFLYEYACQPRSTCASIGGKCTTPPPPPSVPYNGSIGIIDTDSSRPDPQQVHNLTVGSMPNVYGTSSLILVDNGGESPSVIFLDQNCDWNSTSNPQLCVVEVDMSSWAQRSIVYNLPSALGSLNPLWSSLLYVPTTKQLMALGYFEHQSASNISAVVVQLQEGGAEAPCAVLHAPAGWLIVPPPSTFANFGGGWTVDNHVVLCMQNERIDFVAPFALGLFSGYNGTLLAWSMSTVGCSSVLSFPKQSRVSI